MLTLTDACGVARREDIGNGDAVRAEGVVSNEGTVDGSDMNSDSMSISISRRAISSITDLESNTLLLMDDCDIYELLDTLDGVRSSVELLVDKMTSDGSSALVSSSSGVLELMTGVRELALDGVAVVSGGSLRTVPLTLVGVSGMLLNLPIDVISLPLGRRNDVSSVVSGSCSAMERTEGDGCSKELSYEWFVSIPHRSLGIAVLSPLLGAILGKGVVSGILGIELGARGEESRTLETVGVRDRASDRAVDGIVGVREISELEMVVAGNDDDGASLLLNSNDVVSSRLVVNGDGLGEREGSVDGSGAPSGVIAGDVVTMLGTCEGVLSELSSISRLSSRSSEGSEGSLVDGALGVGASSSSVSSHSSNDT